MDHEQEKRSTQALTVKLVSHLIALFLSVWVYALMFAIPMSMSGTDLMLARLGVEPVGYWEAACLMAAFIFTLKSVSWTLGGKKNGAK